MMQAFIYKFTFPDTKKRPPVELAFIAPNINYARAAVDEYKGTFLERNVDELIDTVPVAMSVHRG